MSSYERDPTTGNLSLIDGMRSLDEVKALMLDLCYPIGSMYISTVDTSPQTFLGGTWIRHEGYVLRAATSGVTANSAVKDLGSDDATLVSHSHTVTSHRHYVARQLLAESAGSHQHYEFRNTDQNYGFTAARVPSVQVGGQPAEYNYSIKASAYTAADTFLTGSAGAHTHYVSAHYTDYSAPGTDAQGSSATNANIPNEKNVYMWERVS